ASRQARQLRFDRDQIKSTDAEVVQELQMVPEPRREVRGLAGPHGAHRHTLGSHDLTPAQRSRRQRSTASRGYVDHSATAYGCATLGGWAWPATQPESEGLVHRDPTAEARGYVDQEPGGG